MGSADNLGDVWPEFAEKLLALLPFSHVALCRIDTAMGSVTVMHDSWDGDGERYGRKPGEVFALQETISEEVVSARIGKYYSFDSSDQWEKEYPGAHRFDVKYPVRSLIGVPLIWGGEVVACLFIHSLEPDAYGPRELRLAERAAAQIAGLVAGSIMREQDAKVLRERETLARIGAETGAVIDLDEAWPVVTELLADIIEFDRINLVSVNHESAIATVVYDNWVHGPSPVLSRTGIAYALAGSVTGRVSETGRGLVSNVDSIDQLAEEFPGALRHDDVLASRSNMASPLIWGGQVVAVLFIGHHEFGKYGKADRALGERIAAQIAGPVAGSIMREHDAALERERRVLTEISSMLSSGTSMELAFGNIHTQIEQLLEVDAIGVHRGDSETDQIVHDQLWIRPSMRQYYDPFAAQFSGSLPEKIVDERIGQNLYYESRADIRSEFPESEVDIEEIPGRAVIMTPIIWDDEVAAVLWLSKTGEEHYSDDDLALAGRVATQIAGPVAGSFLRAHDESLTRERRILAEIGELMGATKDIGAVFAEFAAHVQGLLPFSAMSFLEIDHENKMVKRDQAFVLDGVNHLYQQGFKEFPLQGTMAERAATAHRGLLRNFNSEQDILSEFPKSPVTTGDSWPRSTIVVPLVWGDEVAVVLWLSRAGADRRFGESDLALAERIAAQIAGPVAGSLARERDIALKNEQRRREIAELEAANYAELSEAKSNFVSAMSHELRTPLTSIVAFSDILGRPRKNGLEGRNLQHVKVIQRNARYLEGMIAELLDLSKMESGRFEIISAPFDFVSMVTEALESAGPQIEAMDQNATLEASEEVLLVNGDRDRLTQVVNNLLNNASKYSPRETLIEVEIGIEGVFLNVAIMDRGAGITDQNPDDLLQMFHRADGELTRRIPGTGIGLHISKRIIEEHGGTIALEPRNGGGTTARFQIPTGVAAIS